MKFSPTGILTNPEALLMLESAEIESVRNGNDSDGCDPSEVP
jgi:hypothetical protein